MCVCVCVYITGVKPSLVQEPRTSKISIRTIIHFHPMSNGQVIEYSAWLYVLECPACVCVWCV